MTSKPFGPIQGLLAFILYPFLSKSRKTALDKRAIVTQDMRKKRQEQREQEKVLKPEANLYHQILVSTFTGLGEFYAPTSVTSSGNRIGGRKPQKVKFERCVVTPEIIYFRLATRKYGLFAARRLVPHRVRIVDLIREDTLQELSFACHRAVTVQVDNLRAGVWFKVHRLEGIDGLPKMVTFSSLLGYYPEDMSGAEVILGIGEHRKVHYASFATHPHWLVGGSTGSGKSNFINNMISGLIRYTNPTEIQFILIDLKAMEFPYYADAPHVKAIVTEADEAIDVLTDLKHEIRKRARMLSGNAKELAAWNTKYPARAMPRIICVIDEFAELMIASGSGIAKQAEDLVSSITNLGRAVGVHIVVCTQRPAVAVVPNSIKVNMPLVIAGPTPSSHQSQVILDTSDAANLPDVPGRMAVRAGARISQIQTPLISDEDIAESVGMAKGRYLGITQLDGTDMIINYPGLTQYIIDTLQGWLSTKPLIAEICQYGVSKARLKQYVEQIIKLDTIEAFDGIYKVERQRNSMRLVLVEPFERALPKPEQEQPQPEILEYPVDPNFVPYALLTARIAEPPDPILIFIDYYCVVDRPCKDRASNLFKTFCHYFQADIPFPVDQRKFGLKLRELGYTKQKATGGVVWWYGLRVHTNYSEFLRAEDIQARSDQIKPAISNKPSPSPINENETEDGLVGLSAA